MPSRIKKIVRAHRAAALAQRIRRMNAKKEPWLIYTARMLRKR